MKPNCCWFNLLVLFGLIIFAGCSQVFDDTSVVATTDMDATTEYIWQNPTPSPDWLREWGANSYEFCLEIDQGFFWEPGDFDDDTFLSISESTSLVIDGEWKPNFFWAEVAVTPLIMRDEDGNILGMYGGPLHTCIGHDLEAGLHLAELKIESSSGTEYSYTWAFQVNDEISE